MMEVIARLWPGASGVVVFVRETGLSYVADRSREMSKNSLLSVYVTKELKELCRCKVPLVHAQIRVESDLCGVKFVQCELRP